MVQHVELIESSPAPHGDPPLAIGDLPQEFPSHARCRRPAQPLDR